MQRLVMTYFAKLPPVPGVHPSAIRGAAHHGPRIIEPLRLRAGGHARATWLAVFEATGADIADLGEEHGRRVLRVCGKGTKVVLIPLPPAVGRAIDRAIGPRSAGPVLLNTRGARMDRQAVTRRLRRLAETAGVRITRPHPHMLRHAFVTTMLDAGVREVQIAARHADPRTTMRYDRARQNLAVTRTTSWPPTWPPEPECALAIAADAYTRNAWQACARWRSTGGPVLAGQPARPRLRPGRLPRRPARRARRLPAAKSWACGVVEATAVTPRFGCPSPQRVTAPGCS
jgi:hypothetical protein